MSKAQLSAALVLVALFGLPAVAHASTPVTQASSTVVIHTEDDDEYEDGEDGEYEDGEDEYQEGDGDEDADDSFVVPPVVIEPDGKGGHPAGPPLDGEDPVYQNQELSLGDVRGEHPVRVDKVHPEHKTPTDIFVDTALVGLGAVGAGAIGLGAVVGVRAIRARRSGEKNDYFYGE